MDTTVRSTFPEAQYALSVAKSGIRPAQRSIMELVCAEAAAQGCVAGDVWMSYRALASRLNKGYRGIWSLIEGRKGERRQAGLVERGVLELVRKGSGADHPSLYRIAHWSRWGDEVSWSGGREAAARSLVAFTASNSRAVTESTARVLVRSVRDLGRLLSREIEEEIRRIEEESARDQGARGCAAEPLSISPDSRAVDAGRAGASPSIDPEREISLSEEDPFFVELLERFKARHGLRQLYAGSRPYELLRFAAQVANGHGPELLAAASSPSAPPLWMQHVDQLVDVARNGAPAPSPTAPRASQQELDLEHVALCERIGEEPDAAVLARLAGEETSQPLGTMGAS